MVSRGNAWVSAQVLKEIAAFVGFDAPAAVVLPPPQLVTRLDVVLAAAGRYIQQFDDATLGAKVRNRDRTVRALGYHIFLIPRSFVTAARGGHLDYEGLVAAPPPEIQSGREVAAFGDTVRADVGAWWDNLPDGFVDQPLSTYYGPQSAHELLERTTWHCAQHVRQLMMLLEDAGIEALDPLGAKDFAGLPLPSDIWDG